MGTSVYFSSASELATVRNTFTVGGVATDPTTVTLTVTTPTGTATSYTYAAGQITRNATGDYQKAVTSNEPGEWTYLWTATGAVSDAESGTWTVYETDLGKLYCSVEALKSRLGISGDDTVDDYELHGACFTASRWVESYCDRHFWRTAVGTVRTFEPTYRYTLDLPAFNDLVSVAALKTDTAGDGTFDTTWATTDYQLLPVNPSAAPETLPYTAIAAIGDHTFPDRASGTRRDLIQVTGVFGWPGVPWGVKQGALVLAAETFRLKDAPLGVAGFGEFGVVRVRENPKVAMYLYPYRRNPVLVG